MTHDAGHQPKPEHSEEPISWEPSRAFLSYMIVATLGGALTFFATVYWVMPEQLARLASQSWFVLLALVTWYFLWRKRVRAALVVLVMGTWLIMTGGAAVHGGVANPGLMAYPLVVAIAVWLVGRRAGWALAVLSMVMVLIMTVLQTRGLLPTVTNPPEIYAAAQIFVIVLSTNLMISVVAAYQRRLRELQQLSVELLASQAKLRATLDAVPDLLFEMDLQGVYHDCHFHRSDLLLAPPLELIGRRVADVMPAQAADTVLAALREAYASGHSELQQYSLDLPQGKSWFELSVARKQSVMHKEARFIVLARDITPRKNNELALARSLSLLNATLEATQDGILVADLNGQRVLHNAQFLHLWGGAEGALRVKSEGCASDSVLEQVQDPEAFLRRVKEIYASPTASSSDLVKFKNGTVLERHSTPQQVDQEVVGRVWSFHDVTERRRMEEELRVAAVAFQSNSAIAVFDADMRALRVNQAFRAITGYTEQEVIGQPSASMRSKRMKPAFFHEVNSVLKHQGAWRGEMWLVRKNGEEYPAQVALAFVLDDAGQMSHCVSSFIDVTHEHVEEKQRVVDELAQRDALVREVHHHIKNNLQGVIGILRKFSKKHPEVSAPLQQAIGEVHAVGVIHGLQGRESGSTVQPCDLLQAIAQEVQNLWQTPVHLTLDPLSLDWVVADSEAVPVALVLHELMVNAVKHGAVEQGEVSVNLGPGPTPDLLQIAICNAGQFVNRGPEAGVRHSGLKLISALLPRSGARVLREQRGDQVVTLLELGSPTVFRPAPQTVW